MICEANVADKGIHMSIGQFTLDLSTDTHQLLMS